MFLRVTGSLLDDVEGVVVVVLREVELPLEEQQLAAPDVVSYLQEGVDTAVPFLNYRCDISQDLLALQQVLQLEVAVEEVQVGLEEIDSRFLISLSAFDVERHQKTPLSLNEIADLEVEHPQVGDAVGVVQAFLILAVSV
jgi:hypothetical protein